MSYDSTAVVFYGFPLDDAERFADTYGGQRIKVGAFGSCHDDMVEYVCVAESKHEVELGGFYRLDEDEVTGPIEWDEVLQDFCEKTGAEWPDGGPGWHVAPKYS
jgi:hypothetical protein